jgi:hypothetical protein
MNIEHIALAANSEKQSDSFFIELLGLEKTRNFIVSEDLMEKFFDVKKEQYIIRYNSNDIDIEVFITQDNSKALDTWTHTCILINDREKLVKKAIEMGYEVIKVPRKDSDNYYLFLKDGYGNRYEIKSL